MGFPDIPNLQGVVKQQVDIAIRRLYGIVQTLQGRVDALAIPPPPNTAALQAQVNALSATVAALSRTVNVTNVASSVFTTAIYVGTVVQIPSVSDLPTGLSTSDAETLIYVADKAHTLRWDGSGWDWARGDDRSGYWRVSDVNPGTGWQIADGSTVDRLNSDGSLTAVTVPDLTSAGNKAAYMKMGSPIAGPTAAVPPTVTNPAVTGSGAANIQNFAAATGVTNTTININVSATHTHTDSGHTHTIAAPSVGSDAEPRSLTRIPYYRL